MEVIAFDVEHFHFGVADFDALFVGARIEQTIERDSAAAGKLIRTAAKLTAAISS